MKDRILSSASNQGQSPTVTSDDKVGGVWTNLAYFTSDEGRVAPDLGKYMLSD